jgi:beta-lactamase regulating signal transducer with metallopeptidase domain
LNILKFQGLFGPVLSLEVLNRFLEIALKCALVFAAAWLLARLAGRPSAAVRARIWSLALLGFFAVVILSFAASVVRFSILPHSPGFGLDPKNAPLVSLIKPPNSSPAGPESADGTRAIDRIVATTRGGNILFIVWGAGVLLCLGRWISAQRKISRRAARTEAPAASVRAALNDSCERIGVSRPVRISQSPGQPFAWTWGLRRPIIVLPREADEWPRSSLELVLGHELAHILRRDCWIECLARSVAALLWFHPAVWASLKNLRRERELACDDVALDHGAKPSDYAVQLLKIAVSMAPLDRNSFPELTLSGRDGLQGRLASILDPLRMSQPVHRRIGIILAAVMGVLVGAMALSSFWLEDGRMGPEASQYWKKTGIKNPNLLDYSIEQAQARGGWTAVYAQVLQSLARGGVKFSSEQMVSLGARFWFEGKREEARAILRTAVNARPDSARWFKIVGEKLWETGKRDMAVEYFEMARFLYPETSEEIEKILAKSRS